MNENGTFTCTLSSSLQRELTAERGAEGAVDLLGVVAAAAVPGEAHAAAAQVDGVGRQDDVALILDHGDVADVGGIGRGARCARLGLANALLLVQPERVEHAVASGSVEEVAFRRGGGGGRG